MPDTPLSPWTRFAPGSSPGLPEPKNAGKCLTGEVVRGRYRFGRRIGLGGMSTIYKGEFVPLARSVALKVLHARAGDETRRRFRREFKLLATLDHPGLVRASDIDELPDGRLFFAMELLDGRSLDRAFDLYKPIDPVRVLRIGIQVCDVLHAIHEQGIVHRDMKPANVFLLDGTDDQIKLLDLGIARLTTGYYEAAVDERPLTPTSRREHTRTGVIMGTRGYEPPESGRVKAEPRSDVYSTGVMLYRLLTAKRPSPPGQTPERVTTHVPELPDSLAEAIGRAIAFDPRDRFSSARDFQRALEASYRELTERTPWPISSRAAEPRSPTWSTGWWRGVVVGFVGGAAVSTALILARTEPAQQVSRTEREHVLEPAPTVPVDDVAPAISRAVDVDQLESAPAEAIDRSTDEDEQQFERSDLPTPLIEEREALETHAAPPKGSQKALSKSAFRRAMRAAREPLLICMNMYPPGEAPDRVTIRVRFREGAVERVTFKEDLPPMVAKCFEQAVRKISFPKASARTTRSYVFTP